jgi:chorismate mutase-like protein
MLDEYRKQIDAIDKELVALLGKRMTIVGKIGMLKKDQGLPIIDKKREREKITQITHIAQQEGLQKSFIERIWHVIFTESYRIEEK